MFDPVIEPTVDAEQGEVAAPQTETPEIDNPSDQPDTSVNDSEVADQKPAQDAETNAKFAEMRRKIEAAERKQKEQDAWVARNYGQYGLQTWEQYQQHIERERERSYYEERGVDPDVVEEIVSKKLDEHPSVKAAKEREREAFQSDQLKALNEKYDLGLKTVDDIQSLPNADAMIQKIMSGYEWHEAYLVTHQDHVQQKLADRARQAALNNQQSKAHLKSTQGGGDVDTFTPDPQVMANYRRMFAKELRTGKMTEKQLVDHYRKSIGK